jgi:hypothetical protein
MRCVVPFIEWHVNCIKNANKACTQIRCRVAKLRTNTVKRAILEYLLRIPEREYTLMEIVEWWMEEQRSKVQIAIQQYIDQEMMEINRSLNELKNEELIEEVNSTGGINYRIIPDKIVDIIATLE